MLKSNERKLQAHKTGPYSYELVMKNDYNTNGHTQWYYFGLLNVRKGVKYNFQIVNFYKRSSMYNRGLRPLLYSEKVAEEANLGWHRHGSDVIYKRNDYLYSKPKSPNVRNFYSLSFNIEVCPPWDAIALSFVPLRFPLCDFPLHFPSFLTVRPFRTSFLRFFLPFLRVLLNNLPSLCKEQSESLTPIFVILLCSSRTTTTHVTWHTAIPTHTRTSCHTWLA